MIDFALRRSDNIHWQALDVTKEARVAIKGHRPGVVWFTGLSGAGKSTIANALETSAARAGLPHGDARRRQRPARAQPRSRLHRRRPGGEHPPGGRGRQADGRRRPDRAGLVHLAVPGGARQRAGARRRRTSSSRCSWTRRSTSPSDATARGCTARPARASLPHFTGIDSPYEPPPSPEVRIDTVASSVDGVGGADRQPAARPGAGAMTAPPDEARALASALASAADHQLAAELAEQSAALLRALRASGIDDPDVLRKQGDRRSHELIVTELAARRPADAVLSEEGTASPERLTAAGSGSSTRWTARASSASRTARTGPSTSPSSSTASRSSARSPCRPWARSGQPPPPPPPRPPGRPRQRLSREPGRRGWR